MPDPDEYEDEYELEDEEAECVYVPICKNCYQYDATAVLAGYNVCEWCEAIAYEPWWARNQVEQIRE